MSGERLFELRRRSFDTPHFRGIEFIEVEAKSIINHVPGTYLPFNWTINPYRGCSHACTYCLAGDTPILMGDGRTKFLADLRPGDAVYGSMRAGNSRRYVKTFVLDHWETVKPAHRVVLSDGTELIASGDHRFLSDAGWKHITGAERGRAHLSDADRLVGTGKFAAPPCETKDYREGYLSGFTTGPGAVRVVELEAVARARRYAEESRFVRARAAGGEAWCEALPGCSWPPTPSDDWCKGFLAGIFDADGGCSGGVLRISNAEGEIVDRITRCLRRFGFSFTLEIQKRERQEPVTVVRLGGGLREHLRFFHTADPAITRKRSIGGTAVKGTVPLDVVSIEPLGIDMPMFDITTGTGDFVADGVISHNCFARPTHAYMDMDPGRDFETKIVVKVNAPELLRKELRAPRWKGETIAMGTATDPYQRAEGRYGLTREIVQTLVEFGNPFSILTKGTLILRDLDLLREAASVTDVATAFSVGTLDEDVWRKSEPGTPHPRKRLEAVAKINAAGIPCNVLVAPVLPGISDSKEQLKAVVGAAFDAGAPSVSPILLHLRPAVKEVYLRWLEDEFPDLMPKYRALYQGSYATRSERTAFATRTNEIVAEARAGRGRRAGAPPPQPRPARARFERKGRIVVEQLRRQRAELETEQLKLL